MLCILNHDDLVIFGEHKGKFVRNFCKSNGQCVKQLG